MPSSVYMTSFQCTTPGCTNILYDTSGFKRSWRSKQFCEDCIKRKRDIAIKKCNLRKKNGTN